MMRSSLTVSSFLGWLALSGATTWTSHARAQTEVPPPPLPPTPEASTTLEDAAVEEEDPWARHVTKTKPSVSEDTEIDAPGQQRSPATEATPEEYSTWSRRVGSHEQNTLSGSTGLLRVRQAGSGAAGTFRFGVTGGFFAQSGFLCTADTPCRDPITGTAQGSDDAQRVDTLATLSITPFSFLEAYAALRNSATSNSNGRPNLLQVVGDANLGVKIFSPASPDQIFYYGGEAELSLLTGTGGVGLDGGATSFALRALGTFDLNNRTNPDRRIPLRFHTNVSYFFDNSAAVISRIESLPPPSGRGSPIQRTERYGLNVSRVDAFEIGLGAEYIHDYVRPFLEWTVDVPVNRQGYICNVQGAASRGDECLGLAAGLDTSPNRLTLGARVFPWKSSGLAGLFAVDIGTGGVRRFLEETTPEATYSLWFGLAYAVDTVPPEPRVVQVAAPPAEAKREIRRYITGRVVSTTGDAVIPDALIRYEQGNLTGMIADSEGRFRSGDLAPGTYSFHVFAEQYRDGNCSITVPEQANPTELGASSQNLVLDPYGDAPPAQPSTDKSLPTVLSNGDLEIPLVCELKELPRVANVIGLLLDASSGAPVADATVVITDKLNRSLSLAADAQGSLLFQNVPFGTSRLLASAPGYLTTTLPVDIDSRKDLELHVHLNRRPDKPGVTVSARELKLANQPSFVGDTIEVASSSLIVVEELAALLRERPELAQIEIGVHSDDAGAASYARRLTQERADHLRAQLILLGVEEERLIAKGYGPDKPLVPNVSDANRAKNQRVQLTILQRN